VSVCANANVGMSNAAASTQPAFTIRISERVLGKARGMQLDLDRCSGVSRAAAAFAALQDFVTHVSDRSDHSARGAAGV